MRINLRFIRSSAFRLTAIYLVFFAISISAVLGYVYMRTINLLEIQNEEIIKAEVTGLADQYRSGGLTALAEAINRRVDVNKRGMQYMLANSAGVYIAGNLHAQPINDMPDNSWVNFTILRGDELAVLGHQVRGFNIQFPQDFQLVVGMGVEDLAQFRNVVRIALFWGLGLSLLLGLSGGLLAARNFLKRLEAITESSQVILPGNLDDLMPILCSGQERDRLSISLQEMWDQI